MRNHPSMDRPRNLGYCIDCGLNFPIDFVKAVLMYFNELIYDRRTKLEELRK